MGAPNTEIESVKTGLGGNQSGIVLHGDVPGATSSAVTGNVPFCAVVVTGAPGTPCMEVKGDLQVDGTLIGNISGSTVNVAGGAAGEVLYQSAANTTGFTAAGTSGQHLASGGTGSPTWVGTVSAGWGSPTGPVVENNFSGSAATLAQTSAAVAQLIATLKSFGILAS